MQIAHNPARSKGFDTSQYGRTDCFQISRPRLGPWVVALPKTDR
jgi:hypothetical protein